MTGSVTGIVIICAVVVVSLAACLAVVAWAARRPGGRKRHVEPMRGLVQGGAHVGGGRSVMPTRDAQVPEGGGTPPSPAEMEEAEDPGRAGHRPGSPMDLLDERPGRKRGYPGRVSPPMGARTSPE